MADFLYEIFSKLTKATTTKRAYQNEQAYCLGTTIGRLRENNEDKSILIQAKRFGQNNKSYSLAILSDGIGGMQNGEGAASLSVTSFAHYFVSSNQNDPIRLLELSANAANFAVYEKYKGQSGATLSVFLTDGGNHNYVLNIGDSRIYTLKLGGVPVQITKDDTLGNIAKALKDTEMSGHLVQYVGIDQDLEPNIQKIDVKDLSRLFITSDGLHLYWNHLGKHFFSQSSDIGKFVSDSLILSEVSGGHDNATIIAIDVDALSNYLTSDDHQCIDITTPFKSSRIYFNSQLHRQNTPRHPVQQQLAFQEPQIKKKKKPKSNKAEEKIDKKPDLRVIIPDTDE